jgi:hypothetical protein
MSLFKLTKHIRSSNFYDVHSPYVHFKTNLHISNIKKFILARSMIGNTGGWIPDQIISFNSTSINPCNKTKMRNVCRWLKHVDIKYNINSNCRCELKRLADFKFADKTTIHQLNQYLFLSSVDLELDKLAKLNIAHVIYFADFFSILNPNISFSQSLKENDIEAKISELKPKSLEYLKNIKKDNKSSDLQNILLVMNIEKIPLEHKKIITAAEIRVETDHYVQIGYDLNKKTQIANMY